MTDHERHASGPRPAPDVAGRPEAEAAPAYRPPQLFPIGKATEIVQGNGGKHNDGYTGYYWNGEG
jgi:hypothetical protein